MGTQRDELAANIRAVDGDHDLSAAALADELVHLGWFRPHTVETIEELDALVPGTAIKGEFLIWEKNRAGTWISPGIDIAHHKTSLGVSIAEGAPVFVVLFTPGDE